jgi:hypothetical protein
MSSPYAETQAIITTMSKAISALPDIASTSDRIEAYRNAGVHGEQIVQHDDAAVRAETLRRQLAAINASYSGKVNYK